jgi:hypothetical protein
MLSKSALSLLRLLRRWSVGSIEKYAQEMHLPVKEIQGAVDELVSLNYIIAIRMEDDCDFQNQMLEINKNGLAYLEKIDGPVETFQDKAK